MDSIFLSKSALFNGCSADEITNMLGCLNAECRSFNRGSIIYQAGEVVTSLGLVLKGSVYIESDDVWGNKSIIDKVAAGQVFAEAYACVSDTPLMINVVAAESCEILFLDINKVLNICSNACGHHAKLIRNLLAISAQKNLLLSRRMFHTSPKSIRGRLLSYLSFQSIQQNSREFVIPFNRQQLADYLNVDRSAMSNELSKMQKDGLLKCDRSHFILIGIEPDNHI